MSAMQLRCEHCGCEIAEALDGECSYAIVSCALIAARRANATEEDQLVADGAAAWVNRDDQKAVA